MESMIQGMIVLSMLIPPLSSLRYDDHKRDYVYTDCPDNHYVFKQEIPGEKVTCYFVVYGRCEVRGISCIPNNLLKK